MLNRDLCIPPTAHHPVTPFAICMLGDKRVYSRHIYSPCSVLSASRSLIMCHFVKPFNKHAHLLLYAGCRWMRLIWRIFARLKSRCGFYAGKIERLLIDFIFGDAAVNDTHARIRARERVHVCAC